MKQNLRMLPPVLQRQMLIQAGLALLALVLAVVALIFFSFTISVPFLLGAALLAFNAFRLYRIGTRGQYLILRGTVMKVERTPVRQQTKSLLLEVDGKALQVVLRNRHVAVQEGETVTLYISDTTPLYEWQGIHRLYAYLAMTPGKQSAMDLSRGKMQLS